MAHERGRETIDYMGTASYEPPSKAGRGQSERNRERGNSDSKIILERSSLRKALSVDDSIEGGNSIGSGLLTAAQSLVFGLVLVVLPVILTAVISTTLVDQDFHFGTALLFGLQLWLLAHGSDFQLTGALVSLVPLGVTALLTVVTALSVRRSLQPAGRAIATYAFSYCAVILVAGVFMGASGAGLGRSALGAFLVAALSAFVGLRRRPDAGALRAHCAGYLERVPDWFRGCVGGMVVTVCVSAFIATCTVMFWVFLGRTSMSSALELWSLDAASGAGLGVLQAVLLPNLVLFALAWLAGPGFAVGVGTVISPAEVVLGPVPNLPLLGALPQSTAPQSFTVVFIVLVALAGLVGGVRAAQRCSHYSWWNFLVSPVAVAAMTWIVVLALFWFSGGEIGGGPALAFGPRALESASWVALWVLCGAALGVLCARPEPRRLVSGLFKRDKPDYVSPEPVDLAE